MYPYIFVMIAKSTESVILKLLTVLSYMGREFWYKNLSLLKHWYLHTPLNIYRLAHAVAFKTGLFNIGVEGQFIIGMLAAGVNWIIPGYKHVIHIPLVLIGGLTIWVDLWGAIPGYLKAKIGTNEVVNTIMMNFIAMYLLTILLMGTFNWSGYESTATIIEKVQCLIDF